MSRTEQQVKKCEAIDTTPIVWLKVKEMKWPAKVITSVS